MKISDGIAREIPEVISSFKTIYLQQQLLEEQERIWQRRERVEKERAAAGLAALAGAENGGNGAL
jgi:hypothetical protein